MSSFIDYDPADSKVSHLVQQITAYCVVNGLLYSDGQNHFHPAPIAITPNTLPKSSFENVMNIQPIINTLTDKISRDREYLVSQLETVSQSDDFTKNILEIYKSLPQATIENGRQFGILRSDYMLNNDRTMLQVEVNTIAASFACLSHKVSEFHKFILKRNKESDLIHKFLHQSNPQLIEHDESSTQVQTNPSMMNLAAGLAFAHEQFNDPSTKIIFVVQPGEKNVADQRHLEHQLWSQHGIEVEFLTLLQIHQYCYLNDDGDLMISNTLYPLNITQSSDSKISVVYFRAGYTPNDYPSELEWLARKKIEVSSAVKCPNVGYHLAGTKAIQAALCRPGVLERYLNPSQCQLIRQCFAEQYNLGSYSSSMEQETVEKVIQQAILEEGKSWVLKPQREGGGNNFYGSELSHFLDEYKNDPIIKGYVLMKRIFPQPQQTVFFKKGVIEIGSSISELGIYGTYYNDGKGEEGLNQYAGYLLRTKQEGVDEGGVATGYSVLNSIILTN